MPAGFFRRLEGARRERQLERDAVEQLLDRGDLEVRIFLVLAGRVLEASLRRFRQHRLERWLQWEEDAQRCLLALNDAGQTTHVADFDGAALELSQAKKGTHGDSCGSLSLLCRRVACRTSRRQVLLSAAYFLPKCFAAALDSIHPGQRDRLVDSAGVQAGQERGKIDAHPCGRHRPINQRCRTVFLGHCDQVFHKKVTHLGLEPRTR